MPMNDRKQLAAARTNTLLLRYTVLLGVFIVVLVIEIIGVYIVMNIGKSQNEATITDNESKAVGFAKTQQQATMFESNLATAKYILDKQVPYTDIILALSHSLPAGASINTFTINPTSFGTPTTLSVTTSSYEAAINVKASLQAGEMNGKKLFSDVSFVSVSKVEGQGFTAIYDITYSPEVLKP